MKGLETRVLALRILSEYESTGAYLGSLLAAGLAGSDLERRDRALVTGLVQGTVRMKLSLDAALAGFCDHPLGSLEAGVRMALRMGAFQIAFLSTADYAAVDLTAGAAGVVVGRRAVGFVNAVMRAFAAGHEGLRHLEREADAASYLETKYSYPRWVTSMWIEELGLDLAEEVCAAGNVEPAVGLRTNLGRISREDLATSLSEHGISVAPGALTPEALLVRGSGPLGEVEEFARGLFAVQDQSSQAVSHVVAPEAGMDVLDTCAAPGGKANHLAELMGNSGRVLAVDVSEDRLALVGQASSRLGNSIVETVRADATRPGEAVGGEFDRVLVDAPCTGLGTLARRPDARWRKKAEDVRRLASLQTALLSAAAPLVRQGGLLVYSTCTISRRENQDVVGSFLRAEPDFESSVVRLAGLEGSPWLQLLPEAGAHDGMFIAALARKQARG